MDINSIPQVQNLTDQERTLLDSIMKDVVDSGSLDPLSAIWSVDYTEKPVSIDEFLESERYMGKVFDHGTLVYPFWRDRLREVFHDNPDKAFEVCLTGAIGSGKSTIAAIALMYTLYKTMCLKNPQKFYGLTQNAPIVFVVLNLTLELAYSGLYSMIVEAIRMSPWFCERVDIRGKYEFAIEFPNNISICCASQTTHTIGKNVLFAILDEVNFSNSPKGSKNSVLDMYRNIRRRLESRFLKQGRIPGFIFLVSSKNSDLDFLDQYIQSIKHQKTTIVVDRPIYDIKPPGTYGDERFKVAVGDKTKPSRILSSLEDENFAKEQGYSIISVPTEYRVAFEQDINDALKDIAGISSVSTNKLIPYPGKIESVINLDRKSPFMLEQLMLGLSSTEEHIRDYLDDLRLLRQDLHIPRFAAVDIGLKNDCLGFAILHSNNQMSVDRYTKDGKIESVVENTYVVDLLLSIKALPGSEIPLYKLREFIIWLSTNVGINFKQINFDGFQSADSIQLLKTAGLNAELQSVDRTVDPYLNLRSCILEGRLETYYHSILKEELYDVEYDRKNNKVDHTIEGHKDLLDAVTSALWAAQQYYSKTKPSRVIQHQNVQQAVNYIAQLNKKRWVQGNNMDADTSWVLRD